MQSGQCYGITNVVVKEYNGASYLTLTKNSKVNAAELQVTREDVAAGNSQQIEGAVPTREHQLCPTLFEVQQVSLKDDGQ